MFWNGTPFTYPLECMHFSESSRRKPMRYMACRRVPQGQKPGDKELW